MKTALLALCLLPSLSWATQRVIVEKATNRVVDAGDTSLQYDARFYDNLDYPDNTIPPGANPRKYIKSGPDIVLAPGAELRERFNEEWKADVIARINASSLAQGLKDFLIELVNRFAR